MVTFMEQIKLLTYADLHIGAPIIDNWDVLRKIVDIAIEHKVTHIASLGDDFDKEITTTTQREYFATQVKRALDAGIHYGIIPGNHSRRAEMQCYKTGAEVWSTPGWYLWHGLHVGALPHMKYNSLLEEKIDYKDEKKTENETIIKTLKSMLKDEPTGPAIVIGHGVIDGAMLDNNMIPRANGVIFPRALLAKFNCPVRFGHYHLAQMITDRVDYIGSLDNEVMHHNRRGSNVEYVGSPAPVNIGERDTMKGVQIHTFENGHHAYEFVAIDAPKIYTYTSTWEDGHWFPDPLFGKTPDFYKDAIVRVTYKASAVNASQVNLQFVEELNKFTLIPTILVGDVESAVVARAPELKEPMSCHGAVEVYWAKQGIPEEQQAAAIILRDKILEATV